MGPPPVAGSTMESFMCDLNRRKKRDRYERHSELIRSSGKEFQNFSPANYMRKSKNKICKYKVYHVMILINDHDGGVN